ncbi:hypothetical protein E1B28_010466 [Marasmius oreades]|uniref:Uncharacterized protein n=1 Tax=Marasmius oreades TaxID=181124 RepID=A0A9P7URT0_9AGAR|nr:uncharacterized protein E1B28_010466 [Marasmius oreades]KAG7091430.1 hypothetical protein E1B28_010466 [Marasmius oreades]
MSSFKSIHDKQLAPSKVATSVLRAWKHLKEVTVVQLQRDAVYFLHTLFLFTRSDWKTMMFPVSTFAVVAGPISSFERYLTLLLWIWTTLLQFNCANQAYSGHEDRINKPWRPVPAGRITSENTMRLRWIMFAINVAFSYSMGQSVLYTTLFLTIAEYLYNDMKFSENPFLKNMCNVFGYGGFELGATLIASPHFELDDIAIHALILSCALIFTTIHAQDFPDCEGDRQAGRKTLPILFPEGARVYISAILVAWSIALAWYWNIGLVCSGAFTAAGTFIAWRFFVKRDLASDESTYLIYNGWLLTAVTLPINQRLSILSF